MARLMHSVWLSVCFGVAASASAATPARSGDALIFEAEDWTTPREAWLVDRDSEDHWNLWSQNASAGWSGGVVLRSPTVLEDRSSPQAGAAPLYTRLQGIPTGEYEIIINRTVRGLAFSLDGTTWKSTHPNTETSLGVFRIVDGTFDVWIDDRYFMPSSVGPGYYDYLRVEPFKPPKLSRFQVFFPPGEPDTTSMAALPEVCWISDRPVPTGVLEVEQDGAFEGLDADCSNQLNLRNHRARMLPPDGARVKVRVKIPFNNGLVWTSEPVELALPVDLPQKQPNSNLQVPLLPASAINPERPLLAGLPFASGTLSTGEGLVVSDQSGLLPTQTSVAGRWPDGSVRWLFTRCLPRSDSTNLRLTAGTADAPAEASGDMECEGDGLFKSSRIHFDNGLLSWSWRAAVATNAADATEATGEPGPFALFDSVIARDGRSITAKPEMGNVRLIDGGGRAWGLGPAESCTWEETGPVRAVLRVEGHFQTQDGTNPLSYKLRYFFTARSPLVQVQLTLLHDARSPEFHRIRSLALRVPIAGDEPLRGQLAGGEMVDVQQSSPHELWQLDGKRTRMIAAGQSTDREERSAGWATVQRGRSEIGLAFRDFWQTWPKSIALKPDGLHVRLLPDMSGNKYESRDLMDWMRQGYGFDENGCYLIRRGMALRFEFSVRFGQAGGAAWAASVLSQPYAATTAEHYCTSGAFGPVQSAALDGQPQYETMVEQNVRAMLESREAIGEYGWMNFGDWHGERTYNWGNNEYDLSWAMALQFARTGRWDYFQLGQDMARHYATIDSIHIETSEGMPGRVWAHCVGHIGVGERMPASGPAADALSDWLKEGEYNQHFYRGMVDAGGHIYQEGNFAYYFLTGDRDLLETAEMVCAAQAANLTPKFDFTIERGAGWPLTNAMAAYEATGNPFFLNAARIYVERVLAKHDPVGGGWLLRQPATECDGKEGVGGKAFATGILLYGLMRYDLVEPRAEVKNCIVQACRWLVEQMWNEEKQGFRYKTGCDKYLDSADGGTTTAVCLSGLAYGYKLSGDERYLQLARKALAKLCRVTDGSGKHAGMMCRQSAYALPAMPPATRPQ